MYGAFDYFLSTETWHTRHAFDTERFYRSLHSVVSNPQFNPDTMAEYFQSKAKNPAFESAIDHWRAAAWAVRDYLSATGQI